MYTSAGMCMAQFVEQEIPVHANGRMKPQRWHIPESRPKQLAVFPVQQFTSLRQEEAMNCSCQCSCSASCGLLIQMHSISHVTASDPKQSFRSVYK